MALRCSAGVPQCNRVTRMPLATKALLCKPTIDKFWTCSPYICKPCIICSLLNEICCFCFGLIILIPLPDCWAKYLGEKLPQIVGPSRPCQNTADHLRLLLPPMQVLPLTRFSTRPSDLSGNGTPA